MTKRTWMWAGAAVSVLALTVGAYYLGSMYPASTLRAEERQAADFQSIDQLGGSGFSALHVPMPSQPSFGPGFGPNWDLRQEFEEMQRRMDALFQQASSQPGFTTRFDMSFGGGFQSVPELDMQETGTEYILRLDMPGIEQGSLHVELEDQMLRVSATRVQEVERMVGSTVRRERHSGTFSRTAPLPKPVDAASLQTEYDAGVLTIRVKKAG